MAIDNYDTEHLLNATPVYPIKPLDLNDLEYDQECSYGMLPGTLLITRSYLFDAIIESVHIPPQYYISLHCLPCSILFLLLFLLFYLSLCLFQIFLKCSVFVLFFFRFTISSFELRFMHRNK